MRYGEKNVPGRSRDIRLAAQMTGVPASRTTRPIARYRGESQCATRSTSEYSAPESPENARAESAAAVRTYHEGCSQNRNFQFGSDRMNRRSFLTYAAGAAVSNCSGAPSPTIIDTHTHFYDPARPQGVPWPSKSDDVLYRTVLPDEYRRMTKPLGVTGTIVVEASPLLEDNQWILDLAANNPVIAGFVGHLDPGDAAFRKNLDRFRKNRLFLGIRLSSSSLKDPNAEFISNLKAMADAGLELDAIGGTPVLEQTARLTDRIPNLRIVIDHLPFEPPSDAASLSELGKRPQVYAKVSNVARRVGNRVPEDVDYYRASLDELWNVFGADRLVYGSNWPVSDHVAPYAALLKIVREYFAEKGVGASEKFFWRNAEAAYRYPPKPRDIALSR